jgi:toxin ParE1/3/4
MAQYRLTATAKSDLSAILNSSEQRFGKQARIRYRALIAAAFRRVAGEPYGFATVNRGELGEDVRSFHIKHCRRQSGEARVSAPVHVLFYRIIQPNIIEIIRVLHERMEPSRHIHN